MGFCGAILGRQFPWATMIIIVIGLFVLGLVVSATVGHPDMRNIELIVSVGFCGGFTTFSTAAFESIRPLQQKRYFAFLIQPLSSFLLCLTAAG